MYLYRVLLLIGVFAGSVFSVRFSPTGVRPSFAIGLSVPAGEYGDDMTAVNFGETEAGFAGLGVGGTFRLTLELGSSGLGISFDAGVVGNSVDRDAFEEQIRRQLAFLPSTYAIRIDPAWWFNFPIMGGPSYRLDFTSDISLIFTGQLGVNIGLNTGIDGRGNDGSMRYEFDPSASLAIGGEVGVSLAGLILSTRMLYAGNHEYEVYETLTVGGFRTSSETEKDNPVLVFLFSLGYEF